MNINSNALLDRVEVVFYSILTSCMTCLNRFQGHSKYGVNIHQFPVYFKEADTYFATGDIPEKTSNINWTSISQGIVTIFIWMILGFAAGFLLGMINTR